MAASLLERASFFKVMLGDFRSSLQIPTDFKRYTCENLCGKSILRSSRGRQWYVKLENFGGCSFFQDGWETFVADNGVSLEDFLVFFYDGDLGFDVKIYEISGCQKEEILPTLEVKEEPGIVSENLFKSLPEDPSKGLPTDTKKRKAGSVGSKKIQCNAGISAQSRVDLLAKDDKERILRKANSFQTRHPKFVALWRLCRLYNMPIPKKVVKEVGIRSSRRATLYDPSGREWPVDITFRSYGKVEMGVGWCNFSRGNGLALGDACVFEFTRGVDAVKVHIFRLQEESPTPASTVAAEHTDGPKLVID
ncbi:putative B3 domain-containing protein [Iris pallida]|uniref:B3 domain-containing protein n=1 Tax=Iris pallida TaxID=29817 RepID=A0AAX6HBU2_IRIPA|nr:putative B3 domain-containing protein [Iris pallida]